MVFSSFGVFNIRIEAHFSDGTNGTCLFNSADLIVIPINPNGSQLAVGIKLFYERPFRLDSTMFGTYLEGTTLHI